MATLLMFHITGTKSAQIRLLCNSRKILVRIVEDHESELSIGQLAGHLITTKVQKSEPFSDEMLVLADFTPQQLDDFLSSYRAAGIDPVPLKAVMTQSNMKWTASALCRELKLERQEMEKQFHRRP